MMIRDLREELGRGNMAARNPATLPQDAGQPAPQKPPAVPVQPPPPAQAAIPSGILPGEEQVTTQDTFRTLSPEEQASLRRKYDGGGHAETMSYDDWLSENFGELPPQERTVAMRASAKSTPRVQAARNPSLPPETNSDLAERRRAAGKPLPEGRAARQYTPEQRATMQQNVENPDIEMAPFGGSYSMAGDGSKARRAPNPQLMQEAAAIAADQGEKSDSYVLTLAQAYGIDAAKYGDDMDLLRSDVMREKAKHDKLGQYLGVRENGMGGYVYVDDPNQRQAGRQQFYASRTPEQVGNAAGSIMRAYAGVITPEEAAMLEQAVGTPNGMEIVQQLRGVLKRRQGQQSWKNHLDRVAGQALGRDMMNPERARGFMIRSLAEAVRSGDPMAQAAAYSMMGNPMAAIRAMDAAMVERQTAGQLAGIQAQVAGQAGAEDSKTLAASLNREVQDVLRLPPEQQEDALFLIYQKAGYPPEQIAQRVNSVLVGANARTNPAHPKVQEAMRLKLKEGRSAWMAWAQQTMGLSEEQAKAVYDEEVGTPEQAGERTAQAAVNAGQQAAGWVGGFARGLFGGGISPQAYGVGK